MNRCKQERRRFQYQSNRSSTVCHASWCLFVGIWIAKWVWKYNQKCGDPELFATLGGVFLYESVRPRQRKRCQEEVDQILFGTGEATIRLNGAVHQWTGPLTVCHTWWCLFLGIREVWRRNTKEGSMESYLELKQQSDWKPLSKVTGS